VISSHIGYYSLILGFILSISLLIYSIYCFRKNNTKINQNIFSILFLQFFTVIISFISLVYSFVISDFSNETVYNNSHTTKPIFYKISGTWGNHEGSLLLWLLVLTLFIFLFIIFSKKQPTRYRLLSIFFQQIIICGFFLFLLLTSNPFNFLFPVPNEGLGLNPILQDPALAIHPPILYLGYVGSSIIFSASLASLVQNNINSLWAAHIKKWIQIAWVFLTIGILLGSIWAYYELGWGGFWFWDPVENVSLMPWLCLTALLHTIIVLEKRSLLKSWTVILSIATFTLSMSGTFLVRSGILNSVHTFANDPKRGVFILLFLFGLILLSLILFFIYQDKENNSQKKFFLISKETSILVNNWFMMYFLSVVLIGTIYPIFLEVLINEKISIGPPFFNKLLIPFLAVFLIFMSIGPKLNWIKDNFEKIKYLRIILFFICIILSFYLIKKTSSEILFTSVIGGGALYLLFISIEDLFKKKYNISQVISHFGFSLFILSILFNSLFSTEFSANMKVGQELSFKKDQVKFLKIKIFEKENYKSVIANFEIIDEKENVISLYPEIRIYNQPNILTSEADIISSVFSDKFMVINLLKGEEIFNVRYQTKPFMIWIWISAFLISFGGILGLLKRN
jgi:cytochrome c-type biogenesis protein CcmF